MASSNGSNGPKKIDKKQKSEPTLLEKMRDLNLMARENAMKTLSDEELVILSKDRNEDRFKTGIAVMAEEILQARKLIAIERGEVRSRIDIATGKDEMSW